MEKNSRHTLKSQSLRKSSPKSKSTENLIGRKRRSDRDGSSRNTSKFKINLPEKNNIERLPVSKNLKDKAKPESQSKINNPEKNQSRGRKQFETNLMSNASKNWSTTKKLSKINPKKEMPRKNIKKRKIEEPDQDDVNESNISLNLKQEDRSMSKGRSSSKKSGESDENTIIDPNQMKNTSDKAITLDKEQNKKYDIDLNLITPFKTNRLKKIKINNTNFDSTFKDTIENFLKSIAKCFEINDDCASCAFYEDKFLITTNSIGLYSRENPESFQMMSIRLLYSLITNKTFKTKKDNEDERLIKIIMMLLRYHCRDFQFNKELLENKNFKDYVTTYMFELKSGLDKAHLLKKGLDDKICDSVMRNFSVSFRRVIKSKYLEKFKNCEFSVIKAGTIDEHAEIKLIRHLMKTYPKESLINMYIGISKRPCYVCYEIISKVINENNNHSFKTRTTSGLKFSYKYPNFLMQRFHDKYIKLENTFPEARKKEEKQYSNMNQTTSFDFEDLKDLIMNLHGSNKNSLIGDIMINSTKTIKNSYNKTQKK